MVFRTFKTIGLLGSCCFVCLHGTAQAMASPESSRIEISSSTSEKRALPLAFGLVGENVSATLTELGQRLVKDLSFSGQCAIKLRKHATVDPQATMQKLLKEGCVLALFLQETKENTFEVRLYNTSTKKMVFGKRFSFTKDCPRIWAHTIADVLWPVLTGQPGMFSTKIAYCKKMGKKNSKIKHVYLADYDGSNAQPLVKTPTITIAPRWNGEVLFCTEYTNENARLVAFTMQGKRKIVSNFDGINMVPSFGPDGKKVVYCASRGKGSCQLLLYGDGGLKQLTHNTGNNVSPCFSRDGSKIYFCSDYETGQPQIYVYRVHDGDIQRLTDGGYCASPACSMRHDKVAYTRIINGVMQLMLYDAAQNTHTQLTFNGGHKEECSWSPCGNYLIFSQAEGVKSAIVSLNLQTKIIKVLTSASEVCSYPSWSAGAIKSLDSDTAQA